MSPGDPEILVVLDAGYDAPRISYLLADLPVRVLGRMRSDRVLRRPTPPRVHNPLGGRFPKHGGEFIFDAPITWGAEDVTTRTDTRLYGTATAQAWNRLHPRLTVMMSVVTSLAGLTHRLTDVSTVLFGICRPVGGVTAHAAGRALVTS